MYEVLRRLDRKFDEDGVEFDARHIGNVAKYSFVDGRDEFEDHLSYVVDRILPQGYDFKHYRTGDVVVLVVEKKGE